MNELRNRRTGVSFAKQFGQFVPKDTFGQTTEKNSTKNDLVRNILNDLAQRLPKSLPFLEKAEYLRTMREQLLSKEFEVLLNSEEVLLSMQAVVEQGQKLQAKQANEAATMKSFAQTMGTTFLSSLLSSQFPIAMLALSTLPVIAAQMNTTTAAATTTLPAPWQAHEGIPEGGMDLCRSVLTFGCLQGFLTKGNSEWTMDDPQFSRIISSVKSFSAIDSAYTTLRDCVNLDVVSGVVKNVLAASDGGPTTISCVTTSSPWNEYQVTGQAIGLGSDDCIAFQNTFNTAVLNCQDAWKKAGLDWAIAGGVIGGICLLACIAGLVIYCCDKKESNCEPPCCA